MLNVTATLAEIADSGTPAVLAALTKGGLAAATRSLAIEYAAYGIRVNAVSPGIIQTPAHPPGGYEQSRRPLPPLGRAGQISDVVDGVLFLESSPYITRRDPAHRRRPDRRPLRPSAKAWRRVLPALGQRGLQLVPGDDAQLGEHLAQVPFDRARGQEQPRADSPGSTGRRGPSGRSAPPAA